MKRIFALALAITVLFSFASFAMETDKTEEVLASVKERIPGTDRFDTFENNSEREFDGRTLYQFSWYNKAGGRSIEVAVTGDGVITSYSEYDPENDNTERKPTINRPSSDEVLPKAQALVDALNPSLGTIVAEKREGYDSLYNSGYSFRLYHKENGINVSGDTGFVRLNADGTKILSYNISYTEGVTYPESGSAISAEDAKKAFAEKIGMKLSYKVKYEDRKKTAYLSYEPDKPDYYIDAVTGEAIKPNIYSDLFRGMGGATENAAADEAESGAQKSFSEAEKAELGNLSNLITKEEARAAVDKTKLLAVPGDAVTNIILEKDYYYTDKYYYRMYFSSKDFWASATVDAKDGTIISLNANSEAHSKDEKKLSKDELKKAADAMLETLCPGKTGEGKAFRPEENESASDFNYVRYVNDIPVNFNSVTISLDEVTGELNYYHISEDDIAFPTADGVIGVSAATEKVFANNSYELLYIPVISKEGLKSPDTSVLVYTIKGNKTEIDAMTGEPVYAYERETVGEYTDISGHWAENAIKTLARFGIGFSESKFKPDSEITEKEFVALITSAVSDNSPICITKSVIDNFGTYAPVSRGILKNGEEATDNAVTRSKAALWFARAMGYGDIAELYRIFVTPFSDVKENIGAVAILSGLGVLNGTGDNTFSPNAHLTRAAAAMMIYNYYNK